MKLFFCYAGKIWPYFVCAVICLIIESYVELVQPAMLSDIVDVGVANGDMGYVLRTAGVMLSFVILSAFGAAGRNNFASYGSQLFGKNVRSDLYRKISNLSPEALDYFGAGTLMTRMTNDVSQMQMTMQGLMRIFVRAPILCVGSIIMAYTINPSLAMMPICIVPIIFVLIIVNIKIGFPLYDKVQKALDDVNSMIREYLSGVRVVKAFNRFKYETDRFNVPNDRLKKTSTQAMRVMAFFNPTVTFIIYMGITFILWIGGNRVNAGTMKAGQIIAFVSYMTQLLHSLNMISNIFQNLVRCKASSERVSEIMYCEDVEFVSEKPEKLDLTKGIEFRNVDFSYRNSTGRAALSDVSFKCGIGERVGIIGATGSGKTTILSLILQFYKPTSGSISIFGVDSLKSDPAEVRKNLAVVSQRVMLFTGTIMENILWGRSDATEEEVYEAAKAACAHDFIMNFNEQYDTLLGHSGVNMSGGQRQRVAIARALIKKPKILILDDCLSALDALTEASIRSSLREKSADMGCIIVSQKISSIIECDRIVVLHDGKSVGVGTHEELISSCGVYRDLYLSQYGREALANG